VQEIRDALDVAPAGVEPTVTVSFSGKVKSITIKGQVKS